MTKLSLAEQKKLMQAARAARRDSGGVVSSKSDMAGLEVRQPKRTRGANTQATPSKSGPPAQEEPSQGVTPHFNLFNRRVIFNCLSLFRVCD